MSNNGGNGNGNGISNITADELTDYILHKSSTNKNSGHSSSSPDTIRRHALEQLVESRLGADLTTAASGQSTSDEEGWRNVANEFMGTSSFRLIQNSVEECSSRLSSSTAMALDAGDENADAVASKKAKIPKAPAPAAPTSFSLFDMLDSQKGGFALPPRIIAHKIIETHQREKKDDSVAVAATTGGGEASTTLELLEKAEDVEDLSPDPDAWEEVRKILYEGLVSLNLDGTDRSCSRYLKVHKSLHEKCRGDSAFTSQLWGLAQNLVGSLLTLSQQFGKGSSSASTHSMDLCWDIAQSLLDALSHLALDHVVSSVGNEREIERMFLGICTILSNEFPACIVGMMEPMAGQFEIWARLVGSPRRFMTIIHASGLGGVVLRRCESLGKNSTSESIRNMMQNTGSGLGDECSTSLTDIEQCNFLQSLSILRTILFQCGGSREVVSVVHNQFSSELKAHTAHCSFLSPHGVARSDDVHTLLNEVEKRQQPCNQTRQIGVHDAIDSILKPFRGVLRVKEANDGLVDCALEVLCTQTIQLVQQ